MVDRREQQSDSLAIQLPPTNDIKVVKITRLATVLDRMGPLDPSPFSSDSESDSDGYPHARPVPHEHARGGLADQELACDPPPSQANQDGATEDSPMLISSGD